MNANKRILVATLGWGCVVLLAALVLCRRELKVEYHLRRLHAKPDYIDRIMASPEGTPAYEAVIRYVGTLQGQNRLQKTLHSCLMRPPLELGPWPGSTATISLSEGRLYSRGPAATCPLNRDARTKITGMEVNVEDIHDRHSLHRFLPWLRFFKYVEPGELKFEDAPEFIFDVSFDDESNLLISCGRAGKDRAGR